MSGEPLGVPAESGQGRARLRGAPRAVGEAESERARSLLEGRPVGARCAQTAPVLLLSFGMRAVRWHSSGVSWCQRLCEQLCERRRADAQGSEPASPERGGRRGERAGAATSCEVGA